MSQYDLCPEICCETCQEENLIQPCEACSIGRKKDPGYIEDSGPTNEQMEYFKRGGR